MPAADSEMRRGSQVPYEIKDEERYGYYDRKDYYSHAHYAEGYN